MLPEEASAAWARSGGVREFRIHDERSGWGRRRVAPPRSAGAELPPVRRPAAGSHILVTTKIGGLAVVRKPRGRALRAQKESYLHTITQAWSAPATEHGAAPAVFLLQCRRRAVAWWSPSSENPGASEQQDFFCGQRRGAGEYEIGKISYYEIVHPWYNILACAKNPGFFC